MILKRKADIERFLSAPGKQVSASVIYGRDLGVVRERARALSAKVTEKPDDPFDVAILTETDLDAAPERLEEELSAVSMMGGRRLVRLRLSGDRIAVDRAAAEALKDHLAGRGNPDAFFLIEAGDLGRDSPLRKLAEASDTCAVIICYEDEAGDIARLLRDALAAENLSLDSDAVELFVSRLPHERGVARQEIERLVLFLGPGSGVRVGARELSDFLGVEPEASLLEAAMDAFGGRLAAVQSTLRRAAREGQSGPAAVRVMGLHLARLRRVAALQAAGATLQEATRNAGVFWKSDREFQRQARVWTSREIDRIQPEILAADMACKQAGSPDELLAERLAFSIAGRARRLGL